MCSAVELCLECRQYFYDISSRVRHDGVIPGNIHVTLSKQSDHPGDDGGSLSVVALGRMLGHTLHSLARCSYGIPRSSVDVILESERQEHAGCTHSG